MCTRRAGVSHVPRRIVIHLYPRTPCEVGWCASDVQAIRTTRVSARARCAWARVRGPGACVYRALRLDLTCNFRWREDLDALTCSAIAAVCVRRGGGEAPSKLAWPRSLFPQAATHTRWLTRKPSSLTPTPLARSRSRLASATSSEPMAHVDELSSSVSPQVRGCHELSVRDGLLRSLASPGSRVGP